MAGETRDLVAAGAALVWRRQGVLWWVFLVNLLLGLLGSAGAHSQLNRLLRHSLAGEGLTKGFDLGMFFELVSVPSADLMRSLGNSLLFASLFPLFMLFVTGGILAVYCNDRRFSAAEFFGACGAFFWRLARLALFSLVPFGILGVAFRAARKLSDYVGDNATSPQTGFYILLFGAAVVVLLVLFVRLWFDIAQARTVVQDQHKMWPNVWRSLGITWRDGGTLLGAYIGISGVAWGTLAVGLFVWSKLPPTAIPGSFLILEFIIFVQLLARLWQRASSVTWYKRHAALFPRDTAEFAVPAGAEPVELPVGQPLSQPDVTTPCSNENGLPQQQRPPTQESSE